MGDQTRAVTQVSAVDIYWVSGYQARSVAGRQRLHDEQDQRLPHLPHLLRLLLHRLHPLRPRQAAQRPWLERNGH